ncbi:MAG: hypothetical protein EAZ95_19715 [Bacteroidetes bacterium]|nr:MAG: hypothetical protein EAZ95_19715 [Bacteroidota bacterium]
MKKIVFAIIAMAFLLNCMPASSPTRQVKDFTLVITYQIYEPYAEYKTTVTNKSLKKVNNIAYGNVQTTTEAKVLPAQEAKLQDVIGKLHLTKKAQQYMNPEIIDGAGISFEITLEGNTYYITYTNEPLRPDAKALVEAINEIIPQDKITYW